MATKVKKNTQAETTANSEAVVNINLGAENRKRKFTINSDVNTVIEFDPEDTNIVIRASKALETFDELDERWHKLNEEQAALAKKMDELPDEFSADDVADQKDELIEAVKAVTKQFEEIETKLRETIDFIFDSEISETILGNSSAWAPRNGKFMYERIIEALFDVCERTIRNEAPKFNKRKMSKYTNKYLK